MALFLAVRKAGIGRVVVGFSFFLGGAFLFLLPSSLWAQDKDSSLATQASQATPEETPSWLAPIPTPSNPELERQIHEVQGALSAIHTQTVRRKELLRSTEDIAQKAQLYSDIESLRREREDLEALLHDLVEEARASEWTAIDEALSRARWLERQQELWQYREETIRDRQQ